MEKTRSTEGDLKLQQDDQQQPAPARRLMAAPNDQERPTPLPKKCPRCDSGNIKFCYYNNYSLSQPRYFCKSCRRYWTHGGALRNVPVGGGCRKSKRPKPSYAATSTGDQTPRTGSSSPAVSGHNPTGMISGQSIRSFPPPIPSVSSFYSGGPFLSSMAAMQSFMQQPMIGTGQGTAVSLAGSNRFGGGGPAGVCGNDAPLPGVYLPSLKPQAPQQFNAQNEFYRSQQSLVSPSNPVLNSWTRTVISSKASPSFWGGSTGDITGDHAAGPSMIPNPWSDNELPGFDPSQQI